MDLQLKNKTALVTGSTQGIGYAIAKLLLAEGASVIVNGRTTQRIDAAVSKLKSEIPGADVSGLAADFANTGDTKKLISALPEVDILINNAGIFEPKPFLEIPDEDWIRFFTVNVLSGVQLSRAVLPKMLEKNWGRIIFISSESALNIPEEMIHYGATKTMQLGVSRGLAELTRNTNVTVNSVLPGPTKSEGVGDFMDQVARSQNISKEAAEKDFFKTMRPSSIIQRFADVSEIANLVVYLASPLSSATNGTALRADGGLVKLIM
ncbi:MAG: SDR family oxidoreductase [Chitinophagaceae bacterium]|nr:MAG: SDR family oxidoreductase [Chitinophagaceae bacterium]